MFWVLTLALRHLKLIAIVTVVAVLWVGTSHATEPDQPAEAFVQTLADNAYVLLNDEELTLLKKKEGFRHLVQDAMDFKRIGLFTLASYQRRTSKDEIRRFLDVFDDYAINIYESRLGEYSGQRVNVTGSFIRKQNDKGKEVLVHSKSKFAGNAEPIPVNWRVIERAGHYTIVDIQIFGVWMALEQRSQFNSIISRNGGKVSSLIDYLEFQMTNVSVQADLTDDVAAVDS